MIDWKLTPQADRDLLDLYVYGVETFGRAVALGYVDSLRASFERLARNPRLGRPAEAAGAGLRRLEHRRHVVFYDVGSEGIRIVAIVHERSLRGVNL